TTVPTTTAAASTAASAWTVTSASAATVEVREQLVGVSLLSDAVLTVKGASGSFALNADGTFTSDSKITCNVSTIASDQRDRDHLATERTKLCQVVRVAHVHDDVLDAGLAPRLEPGTLEGRAPAIAGDLLGAQILRVEGGDLDLLGRAANLGAALAEPRAVHADARGVGDDVPRVGVPGDKTQSVFRARAADKDRRPRARKRHRVRQ